MGKRWNTDLENELITLLKSGRYTNKEIAQKMSLTQNQIQTKANALGYINQTYLKRITKHKHLRKKVMTYFLTHSFEETRVKFGLSSSELKSIQTVSYRDPKLAHLRKDNRRKDRWTLEETLFLLRNSGIREREWIAKKINRSNARNIKERMQKYNAGTKFLHGIPITWARELWPNGKFSNIIHTKAGPSGEGGIWRFKIIPWHECLKFAKKHETPLEILYGIRAMIRFQEFIFGTTSSVWIRRYINQSLEEE